MHVKYSNLHVVSNNVKCMVLHHMCTFIWHEKQCNCMTPNFYFTTCHRSRAFYHGITIMAQAEIVQKCKRVKAVQLLQPYKLRQLQRLYISSISLLEWFYGFICGSAWLDCVGIEEVAHKNQRPWRVLFQLVSYRRKPVCRFTTLFLAEHQQHDTPWFITQVLLISFLFAFLL